MNPLPLAMLVLTSCASVEPRELAPYAAWRITSGKLEPGPDGMLLIRDGSVRAELRHRAAAATLEFAYFGPTVHDEPLASGELRRQIGLKLRAQDTCNVVYVMWHIEPIPRIEVAVKYNPGLHVHPACHDHGYSFVAPESSRPLAPVEPNSWHSLSASVEGHTLEVSADGAVAWRGALPSAAFSFDGPVGLRSDNGRFSVRFRSESVR
jgi:hypothetical protein